MRLERHDTNEVAYGFYEPIGGTVLFNGYFKNKWLRCYCVNNNDIGYSFTISHKSFDI